jgi:hypothetical protein
MLFSSAILSKTSAVSALQSFASMFENPSPKEKDPDARQYGCRAMMAREFVIAFWRPCLVVTSASPLLRFSGLFGRENENLAIVMNPPRSRSGGYGVGVAAGKRNLGIHRAMRGFLPPALPSRGGRAAGATKGNR